MSVSNSQDLKPRYELTPESRYVGTGGFTDGLPDDVIPPCAGLDSDIFFPKNISRAKRPRVCTSCALAEYCLTQSIKMGEIHHGIWGGAVPHELQYIADLDPSRRDEAISLVVAAIKSNPNEKSRMYIIPGIIDTSYPSNSTNLLG
jgi:hypothetical protein